MPNHRQKEELSQAQSVPPQEKKTDQKQPLLAQERPQDKERFFLKEKTFVLREKSSQNPFSALLISPRNVVFENQGGEEEILLLLRRHPVSNLTWMVLMIIAFVLPFFVLQPGFFTATFGVTPPAKFCNAVFVLWYLLTFAFVFEKFLVWYFNVGIITNERVVDIDFYGLLHRYFSDASMAKVQDVTVKQGGVLAAFLNFGDVYVQTAAGISNIEFLGAPKPVWVADLIGDLVEAQEKKHEV